MSSPDEANIPPAKPLAVCTPVVIKAEFHASIVKFMKLLLHHHEAHARFDDNLFAFLQLSRGSDDHEMCAKKCREIIESVTGQQEDTYCLIRPTWEKDWKRHGCVMTAWFDDRDIEEVNREAGNRKEFKERRTCWCGHSLDENDVEDRDEHRRCGEKIVKGLRVAITEMVRFVLDAEKDHAEQEYADQLSAALSKYSRLRGFALKPLEESLSEAQLNVFKAMKEMKAKGQLPARYYDIAPMAGYQADHCRRILSELVHRKLIVNEKRGYDLK